MAPRYNIMGEEHLMRDRNMFYGDWVKIILDTLKEQIQKFSIGYTNLNELTLNQRDSKS